MKLSFSSNLNWCDTLVFWLVYVELVHFAFHVEETLHLEHLLLRLVWFCNLGLVLFRPELYRCWACSSMASWRLFKFQLFLNRQNRLILVILIHFSKGSVHIVNQGSNRGWRLVWHAIADAARWSLVRFVRGVISCKRWRTIVRICCW